MKIININNVISTDQLLSLIQQKLNPLFHKQKDSDINFTIKSDNGAVVISQPEIYEGFLFRIEIDGNKLNITRSEHYVDDVNSITVESILNLIFEELSGDKGVSLTQEG